jgi:hypothetical protein
MIFAFLSRFFRYQKNIWVLTRAPITTPEKSGTRPGFGSRSCLMPLEKVTENGKMYQQITWTYLFLSNLRTHYLLLNTQTSKVYSRLIFLCHDDHFSLSLDLYCVYVLLDIFSYRIETMMVTVLWLILSYEHMRLFWLVFKKKF